MIGWLGWGSHRPRRGILPRRGPSAAEQILTRGMMLRVWLGLLYAAATVWLVVSSHGAVSVDWSEGSIAPRYVYAPRTVTYQVDSKTYTIQPQELIAAKGQRLTPEQVAALKAVATQAGEPLHAVDIWSLGFLTLLIVCSGYCVLRFSVPKVASDTSDLLLIGSLTLLILGISYALSQWLLLPLWMTPAAALGMILTLLLSPTAAIVASASSGLLIGMMAGQRLMVALAVMFGATVGVVMVRGARRRSTLIKASFWSGIAQGLAVIALELVEHEMLRQALWDGLLAGAVSGTASFVLTIALVPVLENLFGVITDVSLLELSDLNHPLLKELSMRAPGTYHHSLIVATLAEAGCESIGANGLLARVGCYFHDIGKMPKADFFVENQPPGQSRHDKLSPTMSSLIIVNHVKEGIELARAHKINQAIIDFIPGHHGTGIIYYFYRRALEQVEDEGLLQEENFRYPGPRPQKRETAVAMLADSSEAACRALPQRSPAKLRAVVRRIINNKFTDGQLDDCDLTLRDLEKIADAFVRVLTGIYHSRVPYPMPPGEDVEDEELHGDSHLQHPDDSGSQPPSASAGPSYTPTA